jgi:hypothetical protein
MRSREEFLEKLRQQIRWLQKSADEYDRGDVTEAIQMAVRLRVLLYDPSKANAQSRSLLTHLGLKLTLKLLSTASPMPLGGTALPALTNLSILHEPPTYDFKPKLTGADRSAYVSVAKWWNGEVIYAKADTNVDIFRRDLVHWAADKDGGAHVDGDLPEEYRFLETGAGWAINLSPDIGEPRTEVFKNAHFAALRQMTHEVLNSPDIQDLCR